MEQTFLATSSAPSETQLAGDSPSAETTNKGCWKNHTRRLKVTVVLKSNADVGAHDWQESMTYSLLLLFCGLTHCHWFARCLTWTMTSHGNR